MGVGGGIAIFKSNATEESSSEPACHLLLLRSVAVKHSKNTPTSLLFVLTH